MKSVFDSGHQSRSIEARIVAGLERISEAFRVLLWEESKQYSLSPIQIQLLIFLHFNKPEKRKVTYLAEEFNMTKATISDAVKVLEAKKLILKIKETTDNRSYIIQLTEEGRSIAVKASGFANVMEKPLYSLSQEQKETLLDGLMELIYKLHKADIISMQRMCFSCNFYYKDKAGHFCKLINKPLGVNDLQLDCPEHE